jgi:hypothetical protein
MAFPRDEKGIIAKALGQISGIGANGTPFTATL